ncbi:hypothetical protein [Pseudomonas sp. LB3P25]
MGSIDCLAGIMSCQTKACQHRASSRRREWHLRGAIVYGDNMPLFDAHPQVFAYERKLDAKRIVVINIFSAEPVELDLPADYRDAPDGHDFHAWRINQWHP